jgi:hypothetical protein
MWSVSRRLPSRRAREKTRFWAPNHAQRLGAFSLGIVYLINHVAFALVVSPRALECAAAPCHVRTHGRTATPVDSDVPALRPSVDRNDARERLRGLLRLQGLRRDVKAASGLLLCFLFLRFGSMPANPTGRGALLRSNILARELTVWMPGLL